MPDTTPESPPPPPPERELLRQIAALQAENTKLCLAFAEERRLKHNLLAAIDQLGNTRRSQ